MLPEILAPAGGEEQLAAALRCGADAVYFGAPAFNARRNAANFEPEAFVRAVRACHIRGVKAYITLNTLVRDPEFPALEETVRLIAESGADAVIVQDLGVAAAVRAMCPALALHASTQTAVHNLAGVRELAALGFRRAVLARELTLREIETVAAGTDLELEVFVHGAHCMSVSGLCYTSSVFGGRSGNRGLCAQPCRLNFQAEGREYALSLKDMSLLSHLGELAAAGVSSFKIEGRMKRPEYVAATVDAARRARAGEPYDADTLRRVFSRGGFTDGYLTGRRDLSMFGRREKDDVTAAAPVLGRLRELYRKEPGAVPVTMAFSAAPGAPASLTVSDGAHAVRVTGETPEPALTRELTAEQVGRALGKLGGTPYVCAACTAACTPGLMLSAAALNALRRAGVEALDAARAGRAHAAGPAPGLPAGSPAPSVPALRLRFETAAQLCRTEAAERIILPLRELRRDPAPIARFGGRLAAELPVLVWPGEETGLLAALRELRAAGLGFAVCENIGAIGLAREAGLTPLGGAHLNVSNRAALAAYEARGCTDITLSFELPFCEIETLRGQGKTGFIAYGRLPLMRFRACPARGEKGCGACAGRRELRDRFGAAFPLLCEERRYSTLLNPVPLDTGGARLPRADFCTLYFTVETREACAGAVEAFRAGRALPGKKTLGLYNKELL